MSNTYWKIFNTVDFGDVLLRYDIDEDGDYLALLEFIEQGEIVTVIVFESADAEEVLQFIHKLTEPDVCVIAEEVFYGAAEPVEKEEESQ